jgi:hypothetical protein
MTLFVWLLIGHLIGDWILQNDWMAKGKQHSWLNRAGLTHFSIYTATILAALGLAGWRGESPAQLLAIGSSLFITHWLIDAGRLAERWVRFYGQSNVEAVRLMVDQTLHLLVLVGVASLS